MIMLECTTIGGTPNGVPVLIPTDEESEAALRKAKGKILAVETKQARSPEQHRLFFAILNHVFQNQNRFKSIDDLREATLIEIGHSELRETLNGERYRVAKSIAFHNLGHEKFQEVFNKSIDALCQHFGHDRDVLLREAA